MQNGSHLHSNTSISETMRRKAFNFDSISRFCGAWISEKVLPNTPCHCIQSFGGDLKKMAAICKEVRLSQKLRNTEHSISTLCLGSVGCRREENVLCRVCQYQRRSQDFCLGGHPADATRYILRDLQKPTRFGGGGGLGS